MRDFESCVAVTDCISNVNCFSQYEDHVDDETMPSKDAKLFKSSSFRFAVEPPGSNQEGQEDGRFFAAQLTDGLTINQKDKTRWTRPLQQRQHQSKLSALPEKYIGDPHKVHL